MTDEELDAATKGWRTHPDPQHEETFADTERKLRETITTLRAQLVEARAGELAWAETAKMHLKAEQAFLSWLRDAGEHLRDEGVTICDDGTDSGEVLAAKVAECAGLLKARADRAEAALAALAQLWQMLGASNQTEAVIALRTTLALLEKEKTE